MKVIICDIETEQLVNPQKVWLVKAKEYGTDVPIRTFRPEVDGPGPLREYWDEVDCVVGHNWIGFDGPVLDRLFGIVAPRIVDTLVVSRLLNYNREGGHSLEAWGNVFKMPKGNHTDFSQWSQEMDDYCTQDVEITSRLYQEFLPYLVNGPWQEALKLEHEIAELCQELHTNGFYFKYPDAEKLHKEYSLILSTLDKELLKGFPPRYYPIKEVLPRETAYGTLHKGDFRWLKDDDLSCFGPGEPFTRIGLKEFNPGSPKDIVSRLNQAGWKPTDKTKGHIECLKNISQKISDPRLPKFLEFGWTISEENLATLPSTAPEAARSLVRRITLASRLSDLEEWMACYEPATGRIHGNFLHIGSWTHRMSHNHPNMANIPGVIEIDEESNDLDKYKAPLNQRLRSLWGVPEARFQVGCDADSIQLRVFAHYIEDEEFTYALCQGNKRDKTDPHSVNQRALGDICKTRQHAKTFIYSFLMGAGVPKLAQVLECSTKDAGRAKENFMLRYPKYAELRNHQTPKDAERGYFVGIDGRLVIVKDKHKVISGYLQNAESVLMKKALTLWHDQLRTEDVPFLFIDFVHDEWQTEVPRDRKLAEYVGECQSNSIRTAGELLHLNCPMGGNYRIGRNWYETH